MQLFARVSLSLAPSYRRFVFTTSDLQEIDRNHSGGLQSCASFLNAAHVAERARVIVRASHVADVCAWAGSVKRRRCSLVPVKRRCLRCGWRVCSVARARVSRPCGWRVCSAEWAQLNGCACYVANSLKAKKEWTFPGTPRSRNTTWSHIWPPLFKTKDGATPGWNNQVS